jgi:hypothetical protein
MRRFLMCTVREIKGRRTRWGGNVARMAQKMHAGFGVVNSGIRKLEDAGVFWNVI